MKPNKENTSKVLLSTDQAIIKGYADQALKEAPYIENINELFQQEMMPIPKSVRHPDGIYAYRWPGLQDNAWQKIHHKNGGAWEIVTLTNHAHAPAEMFGSNGAITYQGQNILMFSRLDTQKEVEKIGMRNFERKGDALLNANRDIKSPDGNTLAHVERTGGGLGGPGILTAPVDENATYDFGET